LESASDSRWKALKSFIDIYSTETGLQVHPLPFFGDTYYASGTFSYYKGLALRLEKEYYVLSVDGTDPPVFWPLALHEISHCWLGNRDDVDQICSRHMPDLREIDSTTAAARVEEALCDALATRLIGPAYSIAFVHRLWTNFRRDVEFGYPSYEYRLECMARVLIDLGYREASSEIGELVDTRFERDWRDDDVSWSIEGILSITRTMPLSRTVDSLSASDDPASLFHNAWTEIENADVEQASRTINRASDEVLTSLERRSVSPDA
jgi:hypothetical protein